MSQQKLEGFPDPRDRSRNKPSIIISPEIAQKIYLLDNEVLPKKMIEWVNWWQNNIFKHGWNSVVFSGRQIILTAMYDLKANQLIGTATDGIQYDTEF